MTSDEFYLRSIISMAGNNAFTDEDGHLKVNDIFQEADKLLNKTWFESPDCFENFIETDNSIKAKLLERIVEIIDNRL